MSLSANATLGAIRIQAMQRSDMEANPAISTTEWNSIITNSAKSLYNLLIAAYGNDYYMAQPYQFTVTQQAFYALPDDFYKLLGVDLQYSASPTGWVTVKKFEFIDRNKSSYLNSIVTVSSLAQIWYIPVPTSLQFMPACATVAASAVVAVSSVTGLTVGMSVSGNGIVTGTTILSINTVSNQVTLSNPVALTQPVVILFFWSDATVIQGIAGWEEYVIIDAAIKAGIKQENDISPLIEQKSEMLKEIEGMAEGRDAGQASHVSDANSVNGYAYGINGLGIANLRYRLAGSQLQFVAISDDAAYQDGAGLGGW